MLGGWYDVAIAILGAILGSSGLWGYLSSRRGREGQRDRLLKGLAHIVIAEKAEEYIGRGSITSEEFASLYNLVYSHYKGIGGNGGAERLMKEIEKLPILKEE